ncbi:MAG: PAS domain S-box protein [Proteobacteria bacterium]|nr:PAS domain S-box protein [Pseudomonadota bacterium]MBU4011728.1 PAS domain S-box protein [Pseudomonadota bacterium]
MFTGVQNTYWEWDVKEQVMFWTKETYRIHDIEEPDENTHCTAECISRSLQCYDTEDRSAIRAAFHLCFEKGEPFDLEIPFTPVIGRPIWVRIIGRPVFENNKLVKVIGNIMDITERRKAVDALQESEERFRLFMDNSPNIAWLKDEQGRYVYLSKTFKDRFGVQFDDFKGKTDEQLWSAATAEQFRKNDLAVLASNHAIEVIEETSNPDGSICYWLISKFPFHDMAGNRFVAGIGLDITNRKHADEELRNTKERLEAHISNSPLAIIEFDSSYRVTLWTGAAERMFGWKKNEIIGKPINEIRWRHEDYKKANIKICEAMLAGRIIRNKYANRMYRKDGSVIHCEWYISAIYDAQGQLASAFTQVFDVTNRDIAEEALRRSRDELELRVNERTAELRERAEQLARLSSELTLIELRERQRFSEFLHDELQQLLVGAKICQEMLISDMDDFLKPDAQHVLDLISHSIKGTRSLSTELSPPVLRTGDLTASLKWLAKWMYENQGFELKFKSEVLVSLHRKDFTVLLFQSIRELLLNVLKHAGVKSAELEMKHDNGELRIKVRDQGVGFNPETVWQNTDSNQKFGLISIRERLMHLGGRFEIENAPITGSSISLIVPLDEKKPVKNGMRTLNGKTSKKSITATACKHRFGGKTQLNLMIVDDHPIMRNGLSSILNTYPEIKIVAEAMDGEKAVHLARKIVPDVILMDVDMPNMDGLEATRIINSEFPHIRIIGLSMHESDDLATAMIEAGASAYCSKGGNIDHLLSTIWGEY